ncbi:FAD-dependent monooxygenase [Roseomonas sp. CCTCC AB2023176]|uniref:FAD-dependent monooxygenase n=1 Tax=Roseomonas sp. CCTCC AB2023176 TaxID=3342640 RepID=UPI0035D86412
MRVIISGGGIGGLTLALSLHAAGIEAEVHEAATEPKPLGVGINLLPHAVRELTELGLGERVLSAGVATRELLYANRYGEEVWREDRGLAAGYRWPQVSIHRGTLFMLLLEAARERLGARSGWGRGALRRSPTRPARRCGWRVAGPQAAICWSRRTASTAPSARPGIPTKVRRAGTAASCGARSRSTRPT